MRRGGGRVRVCRRAGACTAPPVSPEACRSHITHLAEPTHRHACAGCCCYCRFETAVEEAQKALLAAKVEASSAYRGIGLVKLMGRQSGFITVQV